MSFTKVPIFSLEEHVEQALRTTDFTFNELDFEVRSFFTANFNGLRKAPSRSEIRFTEKVDFKGSHAVETAHNLSESERRFFDTLDTVQKERFLFFSGATYMWDWAISLTDQSSWETRWEPKQFLPFVAEHLPKTRRLIEHLPFQFQGRTHLMGTSPFQKVHRHFDSYFDERVVDCIVIRFQEETQCGRAYVEDHLGIAHPAPIRGYCLDDSFPHFIEAMPNFHYALRVNGLFKDGVRPSAHPLASQWESLPRTAPSWQGQRPQNAQPDPPGFS